MDEQLIISIKDFRKLAGKEAARFSDEQIVELIIGLDFMAGLYVKDQSKAIKQGGSKIQLGSLQADDSLATI